MKHLRISFLGGGNMASSIIGGLIEAGCTAQAITVSDPNEASLTRLRNDFGIHTCSSNAQAAETADLIVLAVKPQVLMQVCDEIASSLPKGVLVLSIAAGIGSAKLASALGANMAIVRCMPNTPALVKQGASVLYANEHCSDEQKHTAENVLSAVGITDWISDENLMDAVTAVSGSGPAYFFLVIEAMTDAGVELGLSRELASKLATQTALGSALLASESDDDACELRRKVTSPNGTTEQAILSFENNQLRDIFKQAMQACAQRSNELGSE